MTLDPADTPARSSANVAASADPLDWSVRQQSDALSQRRLAAVDLVDAYLRRIERLDGKLHAYVEVYAAEARMAAQAADAAIRAGQAVGPLHGIPIAVKDLVEVRGRRTGGGSLVWRERRSSVTASLYQRLLAQGMVVLGKTHTVEFAYGAWGTNEHLGTPWNPWDLQRQRAPGGSSSGSGVAVAARLAPWAIGTDTGGSVRVPASWCGLTSLKPTVGRISTFGVLPLSQTLDSPGPMAQSAADAAWLYQVLQGPDPADRHTLGLPAQTISAADLQRGVAGLRIACLPETERAAIDAPVLQAYDRSLAELADLGAELVTQALPYRFAEVAELNALIMSAESYASYASLVDDPAAPLDEAVRPRVAAGRTISSHDYLQALARRRQMAQEIDRSFETLDALLVPTTATTAVPVSEIDQSQAPSWLTRFANFFELCAVALPNGTDPEGLPTSMQVICRRCDERMALRVACAYQRATDWHRRRAAL